MHSDSKAITSSKERKKFECHETTGSRSRPVTRAITFITNKTKKPLEDKCEKNKYFHSKSDCLRHNSIPYKPSKCSFIIMSSKFLEIQSAVKFQNVESTKILFLFMFYYHF